MPVADPIYRKESLHSQLDNTGITNLYQSNAL